LFFSAKYIITDGVFLLTVNGCPTLKEVKGHQHKRVKQSLHLSINSCPTGPCASVTAHHWGQLLQLMDICFSHRWVKWDSPASAILHSSVASCKTFFFKVTQLLLFFRAREAGKKGNVQWVHKFTWWLFISEPIN